MPSTCLIWMTLCSVYVIYGCTAVALLCNLVAGKLCTPGYLVAVCHIIRPGSRAARRFYDGQQAEFQKSTFPVDRKRNSAAIQ